MNGRIVCSILGLVLLVGFPVLAQEGEGPSEEEMAQMMVMGSPNEHHEHLKMLVGDWTYSAKFWMPGSDEAMETKGTMKAHALLGGRFVEAKWYGEFQGAPFEGIGVDGYDNMKKQYTSTWMDNFGTQTYHYTGKCENGGKVRTTTGTNLDPMMGEMATDEGKVTFNDDGTVLLESWRVMGSDKMKTMEIVLTRS